MVITVKAADSPCPPSSRSITSVTLTLMTPRKPWSVYIISLSHRRVSMSLPFAWTSS